MNLYSVRVFVDVVVYAENDSQARQIAVSHERDERRFTKSTPAKRVLTHLDLPEGWNTGSLPYGRGDDATIGEIIGSPPQSEQMVLIS